MQVQPLDDLVLVEVIGQETQTAVGLILPERATDGPERGRVVAVGGGKLRRNGNRVPPNVAASDVVLFDKYAGVEVRIKDGSHHLMLREADVIAKVTA